MSLNFINDRDADHFVIQRRTLFDWKPISGEPAHSDFYKLKISEEHKLNSSSLQKYKDIAQAISLIICDKKKVLVVFNSLNYKENTIRISTDPFTNLKANHALDVIIGDALHESGHLQHTPFDNPFYKSLLGYRKVLFNIIEDERIDRAVVTKFPGFAGYIFKVKYYYFDYFYKINPTLYAKPTCWQEESIILLDLINRIIRYPKDVLQTTIDQYIDFILDLGNLIKNYPNTFEESIVLYNSIKQLLEDFLNSRWGAVESQSIQIGLKNPYNNPTAIESDEDLDNNDFESDNLDESDSDKTKSKPKSNDPSEDNSDDMDSDDDFGPQDDIINHLTQPKLDEISLVLLDDDVIVNDLVNDCLQIWDSSIDPDAIKAAYGTVSDDSNNSDVSTSHKWSLKKYYHKVIFQPTLEEPEIYNRILAEVKSLASNISFNLEELLYKKKNVLKFQKTGVLQNSALINAYQNDPHCYERNLKLPELTKIPIVLFIDQSGSMDGKKIKMAQKTAILIQTAISEIEDFEFYCYGHDADSDIRIRCYSEHPLFKPHTLGSIGAHAGNADGIALYNVWLRLNGLTKNKGILFVISDGMPNAEGYSGQEAIKHTIGVSRMIEQEGWKTIHIAIESSEKMCDTQIICNRIELLPTQITQIILEDVQNRTGHSQKFAE